MEIHFYESYDAVISYADEQDICVSTYLDWYYTKEAIENKEPEIHTLQMCLLSTTLLHVGYRVFIHQNDGFTYEVTLQTKDNHGDRTVRPSQNMYAMWAGNVFREG